MTIEILKIGEVVRYHRKKAGLTQAKLASLAGIGKTVIYEIERGKMSIQLDTLLKVLTILNIHISIESPLMKYFERLTNEKG